MIEYNDIMKYYGFKGLPYRFKYFDSLDINGGDIVFDCGSYYGSNTVYFSRRVGKDGRVISIEPDPFNYKYLRKSIRDFNLENVTLIKKAISNTVGNGYIYISPDGTSANSVVKESKKINISNKHRIMCDTFINIINSNNVENIKLIYLNIEGSEYDILDDIDSICKRFNPTWVIHDHSRYLDNHTSKELYNIFFNNGYELKKQPYTTFFRS